MKFKNEGNENKKVVSDTKNKLGYCPLVTVRPGECIETELDRIKKVYLNEGLIEVKEDNKPKVEEIKLEKPKKEKPKKKNKKK